MEGLKGKRVSLFYDDLGNVSRKDGILTSVNFSEYEIDNRLIIPKSRVIRLEIKDGMDK